MKLFLGIICTLIGVVLFCDGCKKYPSDPFISFQSPYARLIGSNWHITSYQINGVEHSHDFDSMLTPRTLTDCNMIFGAYSSSSSPHGVVDFKYNDGTSITVDGKSISGSNLFTYTFRDNSSTVLDFYNTGVNSRTDSSFYSLFFKTITFPPPRNYSYWSVIELFQGKLHLRDGTTDLYCSKL